MLNGEQDGFYYMSLSRLHPQRIHATKRLSESTTDPPPHTDPCIAGPQVEELMVESKADARAAEADSEVRYVNAHWFPSNNNKYFQSLTNHDV